MVLAFFSTVQLQVLKENSVRGGDDSQSTSKLCITLEIGNNFNEKCYGLARTRRFLKLHPSIIIIV